MSIKIKLKNCSVCLKTFKAGESIKKDSRFDGKLGIIPISLVDYVIIS